MSWLVHVDESIRTDDGVYLLAAAVIGAPDAPLVRDAMRSLEPRPGHRFHWRDRLPDARLAAAAVVAGLPMLPVAVIGVPVDARRQERARRQCLEALLFDLASAGVDEVWLESRNPVLDRRDVQAIAAFRSRGVISRDLPVGHRRPGEEPLLWAADLVAGAICAAEGGEPAYRDLLAPVLTEHRIRLT